MKSAKYLSLAILLTSAVTSHVQASGRDTKVLTCAGYQLDCSGMSLAAAGDRINWNTSGAPVGNLGVVQAQKSIGLQVPAKNQMMVYNVSFTQGDLANLPIQALFYTIDLNNIPANLPAKVASELVNEKMNNPTAEVATIVYRKILGQEADWVEMASAFGGYSSAPAFITLFPNGNVDLSALLGKTALIYFGSYR